MLGFTGEYSVVGWRLSHNQGRSKIMLLWYGGCCITYSSFGEGKTGVQLRARTDINILPVFNDVGYTWCARSRQNIYLSPSVLFSNKATPSKTNDAPSSQYIPPETAENGGLSLHQELKNLLSTLSW